MCDFVVNKRFNGYHQIYLGLKDYCVNAHINETPEKSSSSFVEKSASNGCETNDEYTITKIQPPQTSVPSKTEEDEEEGGNGIVGMAASPCGRFLATLDGGGKQLSLWDGDYNILEHKWPLSKRALVVTFTPEADGIIVADKAGDVYKFNISEPNKSVQLLLGHISMLLDTIVSSDSKYLITCDRDEKIRVSFYPNCYNIQSFCLGHKEFISRLKVLPDHPELLLSASGDGTCRVWEYVSGKCLCVLSCAQDWTKNCGEVTDNSDKNADDNCDKNADDNSDNKNADDNSDNKNADDNSDNSTKENFPAVVEVCCWRGSEHVYVAVSLSKITGITLYRLEIKSDEAAVSSEFLYGLSTKSVPTGMASTDEGKLWVVFEDSLEVYHVQNEKLAAINSLEANRVNKYLESLPGKRRSQRDVSTLYKHYFDNMAEYLKRKEEWMSSGKRPTGRGPPLKKRRKT